MQIQFYVSAFGDDHGFPEGAFDLSRSGQDLLQTMEELLEEKPPVMAASAGNGA